MNADASTANTLWGALIVEELVRCGVLTFVISPGSRSTPLTFAVARNPRAKSIVHFDERGAAFFAVGFAKAAIHRCALICTSGTAVANYLPALVEAAQSRIPLIVLTADRPPELIDTGANQTINQTGIFGPYVRWSHTLPCPDASIPVEALLTTVDQAVCRARHEPAGPVHLNCPFREPLVPGTPSDSRIVFPTQLETWSQNGRPYTEYLERPSFPIDSYAEARCAKIIQGARRGLILLGGALYGFGASLDSGWLSRMRWPVWADITSGRRADPNIPSMIPYYDQALLSPKVRKRLTPDVVLHIGGSMTSKRVLEFLRDFPPDHYIRVVDHPLRDDPSHRVTVRVVVDAYQAFLDRLPAPKWAGARRWLHEHLEAGRIAGRAVDAALKNSRSLSEPETARLVASKTRSGDAVFVGNSMPIRDFDMFAFGGACADIVANRGASGIDGNIATAAGYSRARKSHVVAVIGDLAALHDLNSLALLNKKGVHVTLVVLNNDGGGIFQLMPIAEHRDVFEDFFGTPHGLRFKDAAEMFGLDYARPKSRREFLAALNAGRRSKRSSVIEVITDREQNLRLHRNIGETVVAALEQP
ncbi:MAG: 2-succinyl-5-enolpyruvyl-6-hydroxy-3-cyclohexene-1-carboxylate synthase [Candidatus Hydrogenedentota bacterium]